MQEEKAASTQQLFPGGPSAGDTLILSLAPSDNKSFETSTWDVWDQLSVALRRTLAGCSSCATPSNDIQQVLPLFA